MDSGEGGQDRSSFVAWDECNAGVINDSCEAPVLKRVDTESGLPTAGLYKLAREEAESPWEVMKARDTRRNTAVEGLRTAELRRDTRDRLRSVTKDMVPTVSNGEIGRLLEWTMKKSVKNDRVVFSMKDGRLTLVKRGGETGEIFYFFNFLRRGGGSLIITLSALGEVEFGVDQINGRRESVHRGDGKIQEMVKNLLKEVLGL